MRVTRDQLISEVNLLEVRPGDLLVIECENAEDADRLMEVLRDADPPFRFETMIFGPGIKARVAREVDT